MARRTRHARRHRYLRLLIAGAIPALLGCATPRTSPPLRPSAEPTALDRFIPTSAAREVLSAALEQLAAEPLRGRSITTLNRELREVILPRLVHERALVPSSARCSLDGHTRGGMVIGDTNLGILSAPRARQSLISVLELDQLDLDTATGREEQARRLRALFDGVIFDHHGPFFEPHHPERSATQRVLLRIQEVLAQGGSPARTQAQLCRMFQVATTDNLGDGAQLMWLIHNLNRIVREPEILDLFEQLTWLEDSGIFGGAFLERWLDGSYRDERFGDLVELEFALLKVYDDALAADGLNRSDRFASLSAVGQRRVLNRALAGITEALGSRSIRRARAQKLVEAVSRTMEQVRHQRIELSDRVRTTLEERGIADPAAIFERMFVFDGGLEEGPTGVFASWMAKSLAHDTNLQLELTRISDHTFGHRTTFILAVPNGREEAVDVDLRDVIRAVNTREAEVFRERVRITGTSSESLAPAPGLAFGRSRLAVAFPPKALVLSRDELLVEVLATIAQADRLDVATPRVAMRSTDDTVSSPDPEGPVMTLIERRRAVLGY